MELFLYEILRHFLSFLIAVGESILGCPKDAFLRMTEAALKLMTFTRARSFSNRREPAGKSF